MRVIVHGQVTAEHLQLADEFFGIVPTSWVFNDFNEPPETHLPRHLIPIDKKVGRGGEVARNYTLVQNADAAIIIGDNEHLARLAAQYKLPLMWEDE